jgi:hypothetical protein
MEKERNGKTSTDLIRSFQMLGTENTREDATSRRILDYILDCRINGCGHWSLLVECKFWRGSLVNTVTKHEAGNSRA